MTYSINAQSSSKKNGSIIIHDSEILFGTTKQSTLTHANPAELFLGAFSACILKNVERFSILLNFEYSHAEVSVKSTRLEKPPKMNDIIYSLKIHSQDSNLNANLLKKNIEKYGTIFNTIKSCCSVSGDIEVLVI